MEAEASDLVAAAAAAAMDSLSSWEEWTEEVVVAANAKGVVEMAVVASSSSL